MPRLCSLLLGVGLFLLVCSTQTQAQNSSAQPPLTVQKIMQDPDTWIGSWPSRPFWTEAGDALYFFWNPGGVFASDSLYKVTPSSTDPVQVTTQERRALLPRFSGWNHGASAHDATFTRRAYADAGDLFIYDRSSNTSNRLTQTLDLESNPQFMLDGHITFARSNNLYHLNLETGLITQLTDIRDGQEPSEKKANEQDAFLEAQQEDLFVVLRTENEEDELREKAQEQEEKAQPSPPTFYRGKKQLSQLRVDPTGRYVTFRLATAPANRKRTIVQNYVTDSGYAEDLNARPKVGAPVTSYTFHVQDLQTDTTIQVDLTQVPGAYDVPTFLQEQGVAVDSSKARTFIPVGPFWSKNGAHAVMVLRVADNKDRWIVRLDPATGDLQVLDRQHDEAWIAGPGISWFGGNDTGGWLPDNKRYYFQSEETGYSHLYTVDVETGTVAALTAGNFEVFEPSLSRDGTQWTFVSSEVSPFEQHVYQMPLDGGTRTKRTEMPGRNQPALSPDGTQLGLLHSYSNHPPEVHLGPVSNAAPKRVTHSTSTAWNAYPWRDPDIIHFEASDGIQVPARMYTPDTPNGAAVLFVHGAGYLQNVHKWWSSYFREYMFHNLLADRGYIVLDVDYRGSAGHGRDWRTAIYRHMGGRDLQDYVDASKYLQQTQNIDPERIAIYGGSYGGFITLMALFTEPEHFGAGAALRSVTDWAHYNHVYTSNILNTPAEDSLAFARSSPINFAEGLEDPLLIAHGAIDTNVQYQDVVRLAQRLIELGKKEWEMAIYPVEAHGFTEPTSWTDEYRRILKLIEWTVGPNRVEITTPD